MLEYAYYYASIPNRAEQLKAQLKNRGLIVATSALSIGVDFPRVVYIMYIGMLQSIINYAQESRRGGRASERVNSIIIVEQAKVEHTMQQKSNNLDVQAIGMFLLSNRC